MSWTLELVELEVGVWSREAARCLLQYDSPPPPPPVFILGLRVYKLNALQYTHPPRAVRVTNKVGMACSAFLSFGSAMVGSFQVSSPRCAQGACACPCVYYLCSHVRFSNTHRSHKTMSLVCSTSLEVS